MIGRLSGSVVDKTLESVLIDAGGVGYEVWMPLGDLARLGAVGERATVHVHTYVREDTLRLFGFCERRSKTLFELLIAISGVGPKMALALLSGIDDASLTRAVADRDIARLTKVPGIGKKTAERICIELHDRLKPPPGAVSVAGGVDVDLISALEGLGYKRSRAEEIARSLEPLTRQGATLEELVREALKRL